MRIDLAVEQQLSRGMVKRTMHRSGESEVFDRARAEALGYNSSFSGQGVLRKWCTMREVAAHCPEVPNESQSRFAAKRNAVRMFIQIQLGMDEV